MRAEQFVRAILPLCFLIGCSDVSSRADSRAKIQRATEELRRRQNEGAYLIVEDPATRRYVQLSVRGDRQVYYNFPLRKSFHGSPSPLRYDVPMDAIPNAVSAKKEEFMSSEEEARLVCFLQKQALPVEISRMGGHDGSGQIRAHMEFIEGDLPATFDVAGFIDGVFTDVYLIPVPAAYTIKEN